jgi:lipoprotein-anchoring transpeptidase ErfK/SrfK
MRIHLLSIAVVCTAAGVALAKGNGPGEHALRLQVLLDAAHFPAGEIDGAAGLNTRRALAAWRRSTCGRSEAEVGAAVDARPLLQSYTIEAADVAGPFVPLPDDMMEKSELDSLGYSSALEALAERFHTSPSLLKRLNPRAQLAAGETIRVPNVQREAPPRAARVVIDASDRSVALLDAAGCAFARYPASMGSENDPPPVGTWKITETIRDPTFFYNPDLFWDADPSHSKAKLPAGPNNPVGVVWVGLSKEHYGIHGTPEPSTIGRTQSHGCIRLTNWDAAELAGAVKVGTPVVIQE